VAYGNMPEVQEKKLSYFGGTFRGKDGPSRKTGFNLKRGKNGKGAATRRKRRYLPGGKIGVAAEVEGGETGPSRVV